MKSYKKRISYQWALEILSLLCLAGCFYPLLFYNNLEKDALIPIHYSISGEIDGWGGRCFLLIIPLVAIGLYFMLSIFEWHPKINSPLKINGKNMGTIYKLKAQMLKTLKLLSMLIFAYISISSYFTAIGKGFEALTKYVMLILLAGVLITVIFYYFKMIFYKDKSKDNA